VRGSVFRSRWTPYLLIAPQLLVIGLFFYWPAVEAALWSLRLERPFGGPATFVGLSNYAALFSDDTFLRSLVTTAVFTGSTSLLSVLGALCLATAIARGLPGSRFAASAVIWPYAVAAPVAGVIIDLIADPQVGIASRINALYPGAWEPHANGGQAMAMIIAAFVWLHIPFNFIFLLGGLRAIPQAVLEASAVDGAGPWRQVRDVRLPLLKPYLLFVLVLDVAESFTQSFGVINATTHGGPGGATDVLVYAIYADGFLGLDLSRSAAESVLLAILMAVVAAVQFRTLAGAAR
jgi:sn-glycerol 3-phosphate transport system permease protein